MRRFPVSDAQQPDHDSLQFERAEFQQPRDTSCSQCKRAITDSYYEVDGAIACESCRQQREFERDHVPTTRRLVRSVAFGTVAAAAGAALYWGVSALTGYEVGLIAIAVGFMVGLAVRAGSYAKGGWLYQTIAVALTYASIVSSHVPALAEGLLDSRDSSEPLSLLGKVALVGFVFAFALVAPVLAGTDNLIGLIIIGIGLYEAWKINKRRELVVSGPYRLGDRPSAEPRSG